MTFVTVVHVDHKIKQKYQYTKVNVNLKTSNNEHDFYSHYKIINATKL